METLFAKRVRRRLQELGHAQDKWLAATLADGLSLSPSGVQPKLSKLFAGDREARQQLLREDGLGAWAGALEVSEDVIRRWLGESDEQIVLVLDPRLPVAAQRHVREGAGDRYAVADPAPEETHGRAADVWLRDTGKALADRNPLLVLAELKRRDFFAGAELRCTTIHEVPLGWALDCAPSLVPLRAPPPPRAFDDDGLPLTPCPTLAEKEGAAALRRGEVPTFPLEHALPHLVQARGLKLKEAGRCDRNDDTTVLRIAAPVEDLLVARTQAGPTTLLWRYAGRYYADGPRAEDLRALFELHPDAGCHPFELPRWIEEERASYNPWRAPQSDWLQNARAARSIEDERASHDPGRDPQGGWWARARAAVEGQGVSLDPFVQRWRESAGTLEDDERVTRLLVGPELESARETIRALAHRPVRARSWLPLWLHALAHATLVEQGRAPGEVLSVVGDVGAGRLLELRVLRFEAEAPAPLEPTSTDAPRPPSYRVPEPKPFTGGPDVFDGGDVRIRLFALYDASLEGTARVARDRRERARRDAEED